MLQLLAIILQQVKRGNVISHMLMWFRHMRNSKGQGHGGSVQDVGFTSGTDRADKLVLRLLKLFILVQTKEMIKVMSLNYRFIVSDIW